MIDACHDSELLESIVDQLHERFCDNKNHVLGMTCMRETTSPAPYRQICSDNVLTLLHYKYLQSLTAALGRDLKLAEPAKSLKRPGKFLRHKLSQI